MKTQSLIRASVTLFMVALAALLAWALWQHYMYLLLYTSTHADE